MEIENVEAQFGEKEHFAWVTGLRVATTHNHTSENLESVPSVDLLAKRQHPTLMSVAIFDRTCLLEN